LRILEGKPSPGTVRTSTDDKWQDTARRPRNSPLAPRAPERVHWIAAGQLTTRGQGLPGNGGGKGARCTFTDGARPLNFPRTTHPARPIVPRGFPGSSSELVNWLENRADSTPRPWSEAAMAQPSLVSIQSLGWTANGRKRGKNVPKVMQDNADRQGRRGSLRSFSSIEAWLRTREGKHPGSTTARLARPVLRLRTRPDQGGRFLGWLRF